MYIRIFHTKIAQIKTKVKKEIATIIFAIEIPVYIFLIMQYFLLMTHVS